MTEKMVHKQCLWPICGRWWLLLLLLFFLWVSPVQVVLCHTVPWVSAKPVGLLIHSRDFSTNTLIKRMKWYAGEFEHFTCIRNTHPYGPVRFYSTYMQDNENGQDVALAIGASINTSTKVHDLVHFLL